MAQPVMIHPAIDAGADRPRPFAGARAPRGGVRAGVWGDGWADAPIAALYGGGGRVEDDELVFLLPHVAQEARREGADAPIRRVARRLCAEPAPKVRAPFFAAASRARLTRLKQEAAAALARGADPSGAAADAPAWDEALRIGFATRVNAAYLWPALEPTHEALSAAAWLGWLAMGRDALLAPTLAPILHAAFAGRGDAVLSECAEIAGVAGRVAWAARACARDGRARLVRAPLFRFVWRG